MGLVNRLVPSVHVLDEAMQLARRMARNGPLAMRKAKEVVAPADTMESLRAFIDKRSPTSPARDPSAQEAGMRRIVDGVVWGWSSVGADERGSSCRSTFL